MRFDSTLVRFSLFALLLVLGLVLTEPLIQGQRSGLPSRSLPDEPMVFDTAEAGPIRVTPTKGLSHPWSLAFLPDGDILVTERPGRLRIVRDGTLDPQPISGVPEVYAVGLGGLMDIALHPQFSENGLVYMSYIKPIGEDDHTPALFRGRLEGMALVDGGDVFVSKSRVGGPVAGSGMIFGPDGNVYMAVGGAGDDVAQDPNYHTGKMVRLADDGSPPPDNPFIDREGYLPEIYSLGHRNMLGLAVNPVTGDIWESEHGPQGGDEVNVLAPGANYGWPIVAFGREYSGPRVSEQTWHDDMVGPVIFWVPSIAPGGMTFYTGDRFPAWKNNLFIGGMTEGRISGTGQLQRIVFNDDWEHLRIESFFMGLRQRIRNVRQGPDGLLYAVTDEDDGALLKIEPAD